MSTCPCKQVMRLVKLSNASVVAAWVNSTVPGRWKGGEADLIGVAEAAEAAEAEEEGRGASEEEEAEGGQRREATCIEGEGFYVQPSCCCCCQPL